MSRTPEEILNEIAETKLMYTNEIAEAVAKIPEMKSVQEFLDIYEEDNLAIFPDFEKFFYWIHQEATEEQLIQLMLEKKDYTHDALYVELESGKIVFLYQ